MEGNPEVPGQLVSGQEFGLDPESPGSDEEIGFILNLASILDARALIEKVWTFLAKTSWFTG